MVKLSKDEIQRIYTEWFNVKYKIPASINMTVIVENNPIVSDSVILYNTELQMMIASFDSNKDMHIHRALKDLLKGYDMNYCIDKLRPYIKSNGKNE